MARVERDERRHGESLEVFDQVWAKLDVERQERRRKEGIGEKVDGESL